MYMCHSKYGGSDKERTRRPIDQRWAVGHIVCNHNVIVASLLRKCEASRVHGVLDCTLQPWVHDRWLHEVASGSGE